MPRGGRRPGAGRKPSIVIGMDGVRLRTRVAELPPAVSVEERQGLLEPPAGFPEGPGVCWRQWAPRALEERTLTPSTEAGFRELCIRMATVQAMDDRIAVLGIGTQDSLPYLKERRGQAAQLSASLKDFKLSAFGKPATAEKPKPAENPWEKVGSR